MLRTYNIFFKCFAMESYLFGVPKPWRVALTRLRIGVHNLQVNLGRHHNPVIPLNNRICLYCFNQEGRRILEDEFHLVMVCPLYSNLRLDLFEKWCEFDPDFCCLPPLTQFSCLMSSSTPYCSYIFSIFVYKSLLLNNNTWLSYCVYCHTLDCYLYCNSYFILFLFYFDSRAHLGFNSVIKI